MAFYWRLRRLTPEHRKHVSGRLLELRKALKKEVTNKNNVGELKIASWNLMHFGGAGGYKRSTESLQYIAEIIDHFDLVSIQEVKRDLGQLKTLLKDFLGDDWDYIVSDTTEGSAGNDERMAVLYRKGRIKFSRVAGEIVLPPEARVSDGDHRQLARSPFYLGFQAGWFKFKLCSVHIHYGAKGGEHKDIRVSEIEKLAQFLQTRSYNERKREIAFAKKKKWDTTPSASNYILLGDFNIHRTKNDESKKALINNGFEVPDDIDDLSTNTGKTREPFDQIAVRIQDERFSQGSGGVIDFRNFIYTDDPSESDFYRTLSATHVSKLKDREKVLKAKPSTMLQQAAKKREKAKTASADKAKKLVEQAKKLEVESAKLTTILKSAGSREKYLSKEINSYFKDFYRKHQISDHLLLWTSFKIDYADDYLEELKSEKI